MSFIILVKNSNKGSNEYLNHPNPLYISLWREYVGIEPTHDVISATTQF